MKKILNILKQENAKVHIKTILLGISGFFWPMAINRLIEKTEVETAIKIFKILKYVFPILGVVIILVAIICLVFEVQPSKNEENDI